MSADAREAPAAGRAAMHVVPPDCAGLRLDQALAKMLPEHSRSRLRAWIDAGDVTVDGGGADAKRRVHGGERVGIAPGAAPAPLTDTAENIALNIVHEDDAVVVVHREGFVQHERDVVLDEEAGQARHRHRMRIQVEREREVTDLVDGEERPVAHHERLALGLPGDAAVELLGALRQLVQFLELGAPLGLVHYMPLKAPSAAMARKAFS